MSGEAFGFMGLFETGVGDRDLDLVDSDSESDDSFDACLAPLSSSAFGAVFASFIGLWLLDELERSLPEDRDPDRERDLDRDPEWDCERDLEDAAETERDRERDAEREVECDSDPECERERDERDESDEEDDDRLRELREEADCRLGEVVLCQGSIQSSLGRRELEIPNALGLALSLSSNSLVSSFFSISLAVLTSVSALDS